MNKTSYNGRYSNTIIVVVSLVCICYAIVRYNIAGDVPWRDLPIFVLNKGISLASLVLLDP